MKVRYILIGDKIISPEDGDIHYISAGRLVGLYGLDRRDCTLYDYGHDCLLGLKESDFIVLAPRPLGDYMEHLARKHAKSMPNL